MEYKLPVLSDLSKQIWHVLCPNTSSSITFEGQLYHILWDKSRAISKISLNVVCVIFHHGDIFKALYQRPKVKSSPLVVWDIKHSVKVSIGHRKKYISKLNLANCLWVYFGLRSHFYKADLGSNPWIGKKPPWSELQSRKQSHLIL